MSRSIFSGVIGAAVLLAGCFVGQTSFGQDPWNHGFGSRDYGYSRNAYSGNAYSRSYSYRSNFGDPGRYSSNFYRHQQFRPNYGLGGFSTGAYGYSTAPSNFGYRSYYAPYSLGIGIVPPTSPYYEPLGVHRHGNQLYAPIPRARAW
jgi:hypothetical protein